MTTDLVVTGFLNCTHNNLPLEATGGTVCFASDGADGAYYTVETVGLENIGPLSCGIAEVSLLNVSLANAGDGTEVVIGKLGGAMTGNQTIAVNGDVSGTAFGQNIDAALSDFTGVLPEGEVAFGVGDTTVTYDDSSTEVATASPDFDTPIGSRSVTITLTGLRGSLTFDP